jgi:hypothetical protein
MSLIPWLRDRDLNVPKALEMLQRSYERRKREDIDNILSWKPPRNYEELFPYEICGRSKDRCPLLIMPAGQWDFRSAVDKGEKDAFVRHFEQMFVKTIKSMDEINAALEPGMTPVTQCIMVGDFNGFSVRQLASVASVQACIAVTQMFKDNYPDLMSSLCFINVPRAFWVFSPSSSLFFLLDFCQIFKFLHLRILGNVNNSFSPRLPLTNCP